MQSNVLVGILTNHRRSTNCRRLHGHVTFTIVAIDELQAEGNEADFLKWFDHLF